MLVIALLGAASPAPAQEQTLDLLDGETLYDSGSLIALVYEVERRERLLDGDSRVSDPLDREQTDHRLTLSGHYGLRHDLQLSAIVPYAYHELELDDPAGADRLQANGLGDITGLIKWRFYRWDAPHQALNVAALAGLELPTGSDDERDGGVRLDPDLQPGSGSWDPLLGAAATYEPGRWRFNGAVLYKWNTESAGDLDLGDELFAEIAAGNRFWLEPYPGPFMRLDVLLRYRDEGRASRDGIDLRDTGGDLITLGANLAFRPRPSLDLQASVEFPLYERVNGIQLAEAFTVSLSFGYRF